MKIKILKDVYSVKGWLKEGDVVSMNQKMANHYINKNLGEKHIEKKQVKEVKEVKQNKKETKENKSVKKRATK